MSGIPSAVINLGCEPQLTLSIYEDEGALMFLLNSADGALAPSDIDGLLFNLADGSEGGTFSIFPTGDTGTVTGFQQGDGDVDSLSNGATLADSYDVGVQFGTESGSTAGEVTTAGFTLWSDDGPLSLADLDLSSFAAVTGSDGDDGLVLLVNDGEEDGDGDNHDGDGDHHDDGVCDFIVEGEVPVGVTLTQLENGDIQVDLAVDPEETGVTGDLRGFFFDIGDESLLDGITVSGDHVTDSAFSANAVTNLGNGANMNGQVVNENGAFDGGVEIGTQGIGRDDIQQTSFVLSHPEGLDLANFAGQDIGLRLTSTGDDDGDRDGSLKLIGQCPADEDPCDCECEDQYELEKQYALDEHEDELEDELVA